VAGANPKTRRQNKEILNLSRRRKPIDELNDKGMWVEIEPIRHRMNAQDIREAGPERIYLTTQEI